MHPTRPCPSAGWPLRLSTLAGLVALTQVPGVLAQLELTGPMFGGMSGVVYGLFGYSWIQSRYTSKGYVVTDQDTMWLMGWFVLCATGLVGHIANAQHALGLAFGLLAGMPAYVAFRRSSAKPAFEEGSWADLNIRGFQRFKRLYPKVSAVWLPSSWRSSATRIASRF